MVDVSPFWKSPFTDLAGAVLTHQFYGPCADMELKAVECFDAYGLDKGLRKCQDLVQDFRECATRTKQDGRIVALRNERDRQIKSGERSKENAYAPSPAPDSY